MAYALFRYRLFDIAPLARDAVIDELADGVVVIDLEGRLRDFNSAARAAFPGLDAAAVGSPVDEVLAIHPAMPDDLRREVAAAGSGQDVASGLVRADVSVMMPGDGARRDFSLGLTPVRRRNGQVVGHALLLHDVTESARLLERLGELTSRDELTGLLSRRTWREDAATELLRARRYGYGVGMVLLDLDQLDAVNEARGMAVGDAVLQAVAAACRHTLRPYDIVGRVGGDEIAIVTPHLVGDELATAATALRDAVAALEVPTEGTDVHITGCLGVAAAEEIGGLDLASLLNQVEQALRAAKSSESGSVVCAWAA
jgi:diguanylate cyclase (GGDEF)-like protein/PAS domain S-box-containing protein